MSTKSEIDATVAAFVADLTRILRKAAMERVTEMMSSHGSDARGAAPKRAPRPAPKQKAKPSTKLVAYEPPPPAPVVRPPVQVVRFPERRRRGSGAPRPKRPAASLLGPETTLNAAPAEPATPPDPRRWVVARRPARPRTDEAT